MIIQKLENKDFKEKIYKKYNKTYNKIKSIKEIYICNINKYAYINGYFMITNKNYYADSIKYNKKGIINLSPDDRIYPESDYKLIIWRPNIDKFKKSKIKSIIYNNNDKDKMIKQINELFNLYPWNFLNSTKLIKFD